jgi:hypothetical protein
MQIAGCQPDSGNPTVRDERGAYGNVSYGGIRNPLHKLKRCMSETLCLRLRAPYFYPTSGACLHKGNSGTWESHVSPCQTPGVGDLSGVGFFREVEGVVELWISPQMATPNSYRLMKSPMTRSCIRSVLEKQIVRRTNRLIRVRKLMCLLSIFCV